MSIIATTTHEWSAKEAKNSFGLLLDEARERPVSIARYGRRVAVVLSAREYEELATMRDAVWGKRAREAERAGYLGKRASKKLIESLLNASD